MKASIFIAVAAVAVVLGWYLGLPDHGSDTPHGTSAAHGSHPPASTVTDPAIVFQKAFWKRPTSEDQILHAERREWQSQDGLSKWQWFITVKPGPALVAHLITDNAFMLSAA